MRSKLVISTVLACGLMTTLMPAQDPPKADQSQTKQEKVTTDPVCGMRIENKETAEKSAYKGKTYYFCSKDDKEEFDKNPAKYAKADKTDH